MNSLYITIGSEMSPQNSQGFYLDVNESDRTVEIRRQENKTSQRVAYWHFGDLEKELHFRRWHPIFFGVFFRPKLARKLWEKLEKNKKALLITF